MESALYGIFTLVGFVSEISLVRCGHSLDSDTSPTRVKIPYARAFHEVISIYGPLQRAESMELIYFRE